MSTENSPYGRWRHVVYYGAAGAIGVMTLLVLLTMVGCLLAFLGVGVHTGTGTGTGTGN